MKRVGRVTRGKTAPGRLAAWDAYLVRYERGVLARPGTALFVDVGFGERPRTTVEAAEVLRTGAPELEVVGVEIAGPRLEAAQAWAGPRTRFVGGGFEMAELEEGLQERVERAMNE